MMASADPSRVSWRRLAIAGALFGIALFTLFVVVPLDPPETLAFGLVILPAVVAAFLLGGMAVRGGYGRAQGLAVGISAYALVGLVVSGSLFWEGRVGEMLSEPLSLLWSVISWPTGIANFLYGG